jgi:hypothetical protein
MLPASVLARILLLLHQEDSSTFPAIPVKIDGIFAGAKRLTRLADIGFSG